MGDRLSKLVIHAEGTLGSDGGIEEAGDRRSRREMVAQGWIKLGERNGCI